MSKVLKVEEVADKMSSTAPYVRELCRRGELKAKKVGKEWVIESKVVDEYLGITTSEEEIKREMYIKELEGKVRHYEFILGAVKGNLSNIELMLTTK